MRDLLARLVDRPGANASTTASAADDRPIESVADPPPALADLRDGMAAVQRDVSRVGRELVRTGATLEALQSAMAALQPAVERLPEGMNTALARDLAREVARERQLREAAERGALDDILAALDGLEHNLEAGRQLLAARSGATGQRLSPAKTRPRWRRSLLRAWRLLETRWAHVLPHRRAPGPLVRGWQTLSTVASRGWSQARLLRSLPRPRQALGTFLQAPHSAAAGPAASAGVKSLIDGIEITYRRLQDALARRGVMAIEAAGAPFDPHLHEAVAVEPCAAAQDGLVLREQQRGYRTADRVVRLAQVVVGRADPLTIDH